MLSKSVLAAFVSDLKPDVDCDALLMSKAAEREKDPSVVNTNLDLYTKACSLIISNADVKFRLL